MINRNPLVLGKYECRNPRRLGGYKTNSSISWPISILGGSEIAPKGAYRLMKGLRKNLKKDIFKRNMESHQT